MKRIYLYLLFLGLTVSHLHGQNINIDVNYYANYSSETSDCNGGPENVQSSRVRLGSTYSTTVTTNQGGGWSGSGCSGGSVGGSGAINYNGVGYTSTVFMQTWGYEDDDFFCGGDDGSCGAGDASSRYMPSYSPGTWYCWEGFRNCSSDGTTITHGGRYGFRWTWVSLNAGSISGGGTICSGTDPGSISSTSSGTQALGGTHGTTWQWQSSPDGSSWSDIGSATNSTYNVPVLTSTTYYRRAIIGNVNYLANQRAYTSAVQYTVNPIPSGGSISGLTAVCAGQTGVTYTVSGVVDATGYNWTVPAGATIASGAGTSSITVDFGTTSGDVTVTPTSGSGACLGNPIAYGVTVNPIPSGGSISGPASICENATGVAYSVSGVSDATGYNWTVPSGAAIASGAGSSSITVNFASTSGNVSVTPTSGGGLCSGSTIDYSVTVSGNVSVTDPTGGTICNGNAFNMSVVVSGGVSPTVQWEYYNGSTWNAVANGTPTGASYTGATTNSLDISGITAAGAYQFRAQVSDASSGCADPASNAATLNVSAAVDYGTVNATPEEICFGGDPGNITMSTAASGGSGSFTYQWYYQDGAVACPTGSSTTGWTAISLATSNSYDPASGLGLTRTYAVLVDATGSPDCGGAQWANACRTVTVVSDPLPPSATKSPNVASVCEGETLTLTGVTDLGGGSGTCLIEYRYNTGSGYTAWSGSIPSFASVEGVNLIDVRKTCSGNGCSDGINTFSWVVNANPTTADAGLDQENCNSGSFTLAGNAATVGTGAWGVIAGAAAISTPTSPTSPVSGVTAGNSATLTWTISSGACPASVDTMVLTNHELPSAAVAGTDQTQCNDSTFTMAATAPATGAGLWTVVSGSAAITTSSDPASSVTSVDPGSSATLRWTVSNGTCPPNTDDVVLTNQTAIATATVTDATCFGDNDGSIDLDPAGDPTGIVLDGTINESAWSSALSTSAGGPAPGFGSGHEINALYVASTEDSLLFALAGNVQDGNRILLFIDSRPGGYNDGSFDRTSAPQGIDDWNGSNTFDAGFEADYVAVIGTNFGSTNYFLDLFTLSSTGSASFIGDASSAFLGANPANADNTRGFEFILDKSQVNFDPNHSMQLFSAYASDAGFLSNQFLTPAASGDGNYTDGVVSFGAAAPDPVAVDPALLYTYLWSTGATTQDISGLAAGTYTVTITSGTCGTPYSFDVQEPNEVEPDISAAGSTTLCSGASVDLTATAIGGSGTYTGYQWYLDGSPIGGATSSTYTASAVGGYTVQVTDDQGCVGLSDTTIAVTAASPPADPGIGVNEWNVLSYDGASFTTFNGYYVQPVDHTVTAGGYGTGDFEFNTALDGWADTESPSFTAGYIGCDVPVDGFSLEAKRQGFPCGYYNLVLQYFDDGVRIRVDQDGDGSWEFTDDRLAGPCCPGSPIALWSGYLGTNTIVQIDFSEQSGNANVHLIFDLVSSTDPPLADINTAGTATDICQADSLDIAITWSSTFGIGEIVEPLSLTWDDGAGSGTVPDLSTAEPVGVLPPAGTTTFTLTGGTDGTGCPVNTSGGATVTTETPPSPAAISAIGYNCQGNQFALTGASAVVGSTSWSLLAGPGAVGPGALPTDGILNSVPLQSTVTVRYTVSNGTGICPDEVKDSTFQYMTSLSTTADGISSCAPIPAGGLQYFGTASGDKLHLGLNPNGNNMGLVDVELPAGNAFSSPALYWSGLDAPLGSYGGGATDPARMNGEDPACPDELFVEDTWEIDVSTQPTGSDPQVVVYLPRAKWDAFVSDGNTWLDATAGLRTSYLGCYNTFPAPADPPSTTNVTVTGYHADGRSLHPVGSVSYDATGDYYAIAFNTDRFSGFALHGSGSGGPLPVTLVAFEGEHIQGDNHLEWITATEQNVSHFVVERSPDGIAFEDLAHVEAEGSSTTVQTYQYIDADVPNGGLYYRLRSVDLDGSVDYSETIWLNGQGGLWVGDFIQVAPNPTTAEAEVRFYLPESDAYTMRITDALGRLVVEELRQGQEGLNRVSVDLAREASGAYVVSVRRADGRWLKARLIKSTN